MALPKLPLYLSGLLYPYHLWWWRNTCKERPMLSDWHYEKKAIFVHIPKTAGTSILELIGAPPYFDTHAPSMSYRQHDPAFFAQAYKFAFVRNPWDRFASAFHFMKSGTEWRMQKDWAERNIGEMDFSAFTKKLKNRWFRAIVLSERFFWPQTFWLGGANGDFEVDDVFKYENLVEASATICGRLGLEAPPSLPHRRDMRRPSYQALYDAEMISIVADLYRKDIRALGYGFA